MNNTEEIKTLAEQLRKAIEQTAFTTPPMDQFPAGCCGDATIFLSEFLMEHGYECSYHCGARPMGEEANPQNHAWVIVDGTIADITGDQFKNDDEFLGYDVPVYVGEMDDFHMLFYISESDHAGGIDVYDDRSRRILRAQYNRIKETLTRMIACTA